MSNGPVSCVEEGVDDGARTQSLLKHDYVLVVVGLGTAVHEHDLEKTCQQYGIVTNTLRTALCLHCSPWARAYDDGVVW